MPSYKPVSLGVGTHWVWTYTPGYTGLLLPCCPGRAKADTGAVYKLCGRWQHKRNRVWITQCSLKEPVCSNHPTQARGTVLFCPRVMGPARAQTLLQLFKRSLFQEVCVLGEISELSPSLLLSKPELLHNWTDLWNTGFFQLSLVFWQLFFWIPICVPQSWLEWSVCKVAPVMSC